MTVTEAAEPSDEGAEAGTAEPTSTPRADPPLVSVGPIAPSDILRLPSFDDVSERQLARANQRRHDRAAHTIAAQLGRPLEAVLEPESNHTTGYTSPTMWSLPTAWPDVAAIYEQLDNVIRHDDTRPGRLAIGLESALSGVTDELSFDTTYALHRPNNNQIAAKLADGASVVVRAVSRHLDGMDELVAALETLLGATTEADAILFGPGCTHVDTANRGGAVLVLPLDVELSAAVAMDSANGDDTPGTSATPPDEHPITVPSGSAVTVGSDQSLRLRSSAAGVALRIVLPVPTRNQLWSQAATVARYHPLLRADLPTDLDAPIESYGGSLYERPGAFHAEASLALGQTPLMHALASVRAHVPTRSTCGLFDNQRARAGALPTLRAAIPGGAVLTNADDQQVLAASGVTLRIAAELATRLIPHLDGEVFDPTPLVEGFAPSSDDSRDNARDPNRAIEALKILLEAEILEVVT